MYLCQGRVQANTKWNYMGDCDGYSSISQDCWIRLGSRLAWYEILSVCFRGLQRGHLENPYERDLVWTRSVSMMHIWQISWSEDVWQGKLGAPEHRGLRWRAMLQDHMARRTCFREQYYTGTRKYICVREDCRQYEAETMCKFEMVFIKYLRIGQFVWARVLCGTRSYQSASLDCSGVIQKIHMRKI